MKKENRHFLLYSLLLAFVFLAVCSKSSFLYPFNDWYDANDFLTLGKGMLHGLVPYRDLYEQKGPILYAAHALCALVPGRPFLASIFWRWVRSPASYIICQNHPPLSAPCCRLRHSSGAVCPAALRGKLLSGRQRRRTVRSPAGGDPLSHPGLFPGISGPSHALRHSTDRRRAGRMHSLGKIYPSGLSSGLHGYALFPLCQRPEASAGHQELLRLPGRHGSSHGTGAALFCRKSRPGQPVPGVFLQQYFSL